MSERIQSLIPALATNGLARLLTHPVLAAAEFCFASSMGFSRMYLGAHYPLDVCVGAGLGMCCGIAARHACAVMLAG
jgi:membrane-associated phospholipid phosphatase